MPLFIIIYNFRGVGFLLLGGAVYAIGVGALSSVAPTWAPAALAGIAVIAADGAYRMKFRNDEGLGCLFYPSCGGHLWFIPLWAIGLSAMIAAALDDGAPRARAPRPRPAVSAAATSAAPR